MSKLTMLVSSLIASLAAGSVAAAHPGHGEGGGNFTVLHYLTEPAHLLAALVLVAVIFLAGVGLRIARRAILGALIGLSSRPRL